MAGGSSFFPVRRVQAALVFSLFVTASSPGWASPPPDGEAAHSAQAKSAHRGPEATAKPRWSDLTLAQQQALAPLAAQWDALEASRKDKWLAISRKFATMGPEEQQRVQDRMRDWVQLTPEQRRLARESYSRAKKLDPNQKSAQWEEYQQLSEEQKQKLAAATAARKRVATLPPTGTAGKDSKTIPPVKSAPRPVLEQSVTPQAAARSAIQPSVPPK